MIEYVNFYLEINCYCYLDDLSIYKTYSSGYLSLHMMCKSICA